MNFCYNFTIFIFTFIIFFQSHSIALAIAPECTEASRLVQEAMTLMAATGRDESTKLKSFIRDGWQTSYDRVTIIRSLDVKNCHIMDEIVKVEVVFHVLGQLRIDGPRSDQVFYIANERDDNYELHLIYSDNTVKIDDIRWLETHVQPEYAINILKEVIHSEPKSRHKMQAMINQIRSAAKK